MNELVRWVNDGAPWTFHIIVLLAFSLPVILAAVIFALVGRRGSRVTLILSTALCALGLLILIVGFVGWQFSLHQMEETVANVIPEAQESIRAAGNAEARVIIISAAAACVPALVMGVALLGLGVSCLPRFNPPEQGGAAARDRN